MPGNASGSMDGVALKGLTVDFHEPGFAGQIGGENNQPFWFQMTDEQRQKAGSPWGPTNPQALNRYSYVQNAPVRYIDPTGHINTCVLQYGVIECLKRAGNNILKAVAWATDQLIKAAGIAYLPSDHKHHIFGQSKHNWDKTGLSQAENERLVTEIANDLSNYVSSTTVRGGVVETYERTVGGNTVVVKVFEDAAGNRIISDAWIK